jgi:hypothetical protein
MNTPLRCAALLLGLAFAAPARAQDEAGEQAPPNRIRALLAAHRDALAAELAAGGLSEERRAQLTAKHDLHDAILRDPGTYRAQILLGEIVERDGKKTLVRSDWRRDDEYFYPAATVMLPGAIAALERVNELARTSEPELTPTTTLAFQGTKKRPQLEASDPTNLEGGTFTVAHLIRRALIVSDADAFYRLYDFCGQDWLNQRMRRAGLISTRISHRLQEGLTRNDNRHTPTVELRYPSGTHLLPEQWGTLELGLANVTGVYVGRAHFQGIERVDQPMSFFHSNRMSLSDLQACLVRVVMPDVELPSSGEPFDLTETQRAMLLGALSCYPGDSKNPAYDRAKYPDDYAKFFLPGLERVVPRERLTLADRIGLAYGFATETAYVLDRETGRSFFLAATILANTDGVLDDDVYDYETVAFPWLADVAELVARDVWRAR